MKYINTTFIKLAALVVFASFSTINARGQESEINPGEVKIEGGSPSLKLIDAGGTEVGDIRSFLGALIVENPSTASTSQTLFYNNGLLNMQLQDDGDAYFKYNVGIGWATPTERFEVNGNIRLRNGGLRINQPSTSQSSVGNGIRFINTSASDEWRIMNTGSTFSFFHQNTRVSLIQSDGGYLVLSDARFKENINPLEPTLPKVIALRPCTYNYKHLPTDTKSTGFIAQEVQELFPNAVGTAKDGSLAVNYDYFAVISIQAIKEQQKLINALQNQNDQIVDSLNELKLEINKLKNNK